ncbi:hypothetical protein F5Y07DRAFT_350055 [Xylaria sp. FL0933]|nr:hypothetical protein F5Y07DRAFT_350055 [Xylaria sp. FL0933]
MPGVIIKPLAGCIKWLPKKDQLVPNDFTIDEGCCHHPVVILSSQARNGRVEILIITSFGGLDLETKFPAHLAARHDHLPIAPSKAHPDNGILLVLEDRSCELRKKSYVKTRDRHSILLASLKPYNRQGPDIFISKRSYKTLVQHCKFTESQHLPLSYTLPDSRIQLTPTRDDDLEQRLYSGRSNVDEDTRALFYFLRNTLGNDRPNQLHCNSETPRTYSAARTPRIAASRAERRPLLPTYEEHRPRVYANRTVLPTTYPIRSDYGSDSSKPFNWDKLLKCMKIIAWICFVLLIAYGFYCGGEWVVALCGRALGWVKEAFQSIKEKADSIWASSLQTFRFRGLGR